MEIHLEKLPDEPFLILKYTGALHDALDYQIIEATQRALKQATRPFYLVIDTREVESAFIDLVTFIRQFRQHKTNGQAFVMLPVIPPIFVGTNRLVEYIHREFEGMMVYDTLDEALSYIRKHYKENEAI